MTPPLLIACALRIERLALRAGSSRAVVMRTGMGPRAAGRAVTDALARPALREAAVLATGFCGGIAPSTRPGDVVVAPGAEALAAAAEAAGHTVHVGPITESDHVVGRAERAALRARGALAVDMESAAVTRAALAGGACAVAVARVVVDGPGSELVRLGTLRTGVTAFRVLRELVPIFFEWHRSTAFPGR